MQQKILVIDDDPDMCLLLKQFLTRHHYEVQTAHNGRLGLETLYSFRPDLVMTDFRLGDFDGGELLSRIKEKFPKVPVIIITGYSDMRIATNMMRQGAYDYITKPLFPDEILLTIKNALKSSTQAPTVSSTLAESEQYIFGESAIAKELFKQVDLVAPTNYSVIIYGESGAGKEAIAHEIHKRSRRHDEPFVAMDCGAISKELAGSELFGHEKGAFTGALNQKIGHFELANGGTLFLDEVANLPYEVQSSLLRVVQERKVKRLGGTKEISLDVRLIVASNERLTDACKRGKFREDLYHRFNEFSLEVPSLRNRGEDIMTFARFFLQQTNHELGKQVKGFADDVLLHFSNYPWPGNLRELKNVIKRATLLTDGDWIEGKTLPFEIANYSRLLFLENGPVATETPATPRRPNLKSAALDAEYEMIMKILRQTNFNKSETARLLGIDRKTLYNKMKLLEL